MPTLNQNRTGQLPPEFEFVYKSESLLSQIRSGSYGELISYYSPELATSLARGLNYPYRLNVEGVMVYGQTGAAIDRLLQPIELMLNWGFWDDIATQSRHVIAQPFIDVAGCGNCPGDTMWISPEYSILELCDSIYHEWLHNLGWTAEPLEHEWIYQQAAKVKAYLAGVTGLPLLPTPHLKLPPSQTQGNHWGIKIEGNYDAVQTCIAALDEIATNSLNGIRDLKRCCSRIVLLDLEHWGHCRPLLQLLGYRTIAINRALSVSEMALTIIHELTHMLNPLAGEQPSEAAEQLYLAGHY
jgi:hypothetical protein